MINHKFYNQIKRLLFFCLFLVVMLGCKTKVELNEPEIEYLVEPTIKIVEAKINKVNTKDSYVIAEIQGKKVGIIGVSNSTAFAKLKVTPLKKNNRYIMGIYGPIKMWWDYFYLGCDAHLYILEKYGKLLNLDWFQCINMDKTGVYPLTEDIIDGTDYDALNDVYEAPKW